MKRTGRGKKEGEGDKLLPVTVLRLTISITIITITLRISIYRHDSSHVPGEFHGIYVGGHDFVLQQVTAFDQLLNSIVIKYAKNR